MTALNAGLLHSLKGNISKEIGKRVSKFGPLIAWQIQEDGAALQVSLKYVSTDLSEFNIACCYNLAFNPNR